MPNLCFAALITAFSSLICIAHTQECTGGVRGGADQLCPVTDSPTMIRKRFLLFGDSLTQQSFEEGGWGSKLVSRYQRKADVTLRGYSGYNTR